MTYDPNGRYEPVDRTGYGTWAVLGLIALFIVVGFIYWGASGGGNSETASAPMTRGETTGMGGSTAPARPMTSPATPAAPPAPADRAK
jgi:hypothetical protein